MNRWERYGVVIVVALALTIGALMWVADATRDTAPDVDGSVGRCLQAQRVLYHVERGEAAEKCLANLDRNGSKKFARTWAGYDTEEGLW
ncbi:MAG: hypothetical protein ACRDTJ_02360 [Pseudonocardiaceae bacterium]